MNKTKNKNIVLLMMGGKGSRFQHDVPKQFTPIHGIPLYLYILKKIVLMDEIDEVVLITNPDYYEDTLKWNEMIPTDKIRGVLKGGKGRSQDVSDALSFVRTFALDDDIVLIHDATHPYVDVEGTKAVIKAIKKYGGATLGGKQYDTVYYTEDGMLKEVVNRENVVSGASPEGFRFHLIYDVYQNSSKEELDKMTSAGAIALANHIPMAIIPSNVLNLKITYPQDMDIFENLVDNYFFKEDK